jgi:hypothetical protein
MRERMSAAPHARADATPQTHGQPRGALAVTTAPGVAYPQLPAPGVFSSRGVTVTAAP